MNKVFRIVVCNKVLCYTSMMMWKLDQRRVAHRFCALSLAIVIFLVSGSSEVCVLGQASQVEAILCSASESCCNPNESLWTHASGMCCTEYDPVENPDFAECCKVTALPATLPSSASINLSKGHHWSAPNGYTYAYFSISSVELYKQRDYTHHSMLGNSGVVLRC